jgi:hypothetical protein
MRCAIVRSWPGECAKALGRRSTTRSTLGACRQRRPTGGGLCCAASCPAAERVFRASQSAIAKRVLSEAEVAVLLRFLPNFSRDVDDALILYLWTAVPRRRDRGHGTA